MNRSSPRRRGRSWAKVLTETSGFLISCAIPDASISKYASRSARRRSTSSSLSGVRSLKTATAPSTTPSGSCSGDVAQMIGLVVLPSDRLISGCVRALPSTTVSVSISRTSAGSTRTD